MTPRGESARPGFLLSRDFVNVATLAMFGYMYGWVTRWTLDPFVGENGSLGAFFTAQADAMTKGRLWVDQSVAGLTNECWWVNDKCYGYYGIAPSLLRLPLVLLGMPASVSLHWLFVPLASAICFWNVLELCRTTITERPTSSRKTAGLAMALIAVVTGPGSVLTLLADPQKYQEALLWNMTFSILAVRSFLRWRTKRQRSSLYCCAVLCALAVNSRHTSVLLGAFLATAVLLPTWRTPFRNLPMLRDAVILALLPIVTAGAVFFLKFGTPLPTYNGYDSVNEAYSTSDAVPSTGLRYLPTALLTYLRPDAVRLTAEWPPVRFRFNSAGEWAPDYLWPLSGGEMMVEKSTSITTTMPLLTLAALATMVTLRRRVLTDVAVLIGLLSPALLTSLNWGMTTRYLGEFYPLLAFSLAFQLPHLSAIGALPNGIRRLLWAFAIALSLWSVLVTGGLLYRYSWAYVT